MHFASRDDSVASRRRRPTVRIRSRRLSWAGAISLAVAGAAALLVIIVRVLVRTDEPIVAFERTFEDVDVAWRCEAGHEFHAAGQADPRVCWTCGRPAFAVTQYVCPVHGNFDVLVKFQKNDEGVTVPAARKIAGKDWGSDDKPIECPRCRRPLVRSFPEAMTNPRRDPPPRRDRQ